MVAEHDVDQSALIKRARLPAIAGQCARCEGDKVDGLAGGDGFAIEMACASGQQGEPRCDGVLLADDVQPLDVLSCDVAVRTHVDDVDSAHRWVVLQEFDCSSDDTTSNEALPEPGFVSDEEPARSVLIVVHAPNDVIHGGPLKACECRQACGGVEASHRRNFASESWAPVTASQSSSKPSGRVSRPSGVVRSRSTRRPRSSSAPRLVARARVSASNTPSSMRLRAVWLSASPVLPKVGLEPRRHASTAQAEEQEEEPKKLRRAVDLACDHCVESTGGVVDEECPHDGRGSYGLRRPFEFDT